MRSRLAALRSLRIADIDVESAARHFDLPIAEQFAGDRELRRGLAATRGALLGLFGGMDALPVWRGMVVDPEWVASLREDAPVGSCWAWGRDGAVKGAALDRSGEGGVVLAGRVGFAAIDWATTVAVNTFHEDEQEIVLVEGAEIELVAVAEWPTGRALFSSPKGLRVKAGRPDQDADENQSVRAP